MLQLEEIIDNMNFFLFVRFLWCAFEFGQPLWIQGRFLNILDLWILKNQSFWIQGPIFHSSLTSTTQVLYLIMCVGRDELLIHFEKGFEHYPYPSCSVFLLISSILFCRLFEYLADAQLDFPVIHHIQFPEGTQRHESLTRGACSDKLSPC